MCTTGCPTQDHRSWGDCVRAKGIQIDQHALKHSLAGEKDKERRLGRYQDARAAGLQPKSTQWKHVRECFETGGVAPTPIQPATVGGD